MTPNTVRRLVAALPPQTRIIVADSFTTPAGAQSISDGVQHPGTGDRDTCRAMTVAEFCMPSAERPRSSRPGTACLRPEGKPTYDGLLLSGRDDVTQLKVWVETGVPPELGPLWSHWQCLADGVWRARRQGMPRAEAEIELAIRGVGELRLTDLAEVLAISEYRHRVNVAGDPWWDVRPIT